MKDQEIIMPYKTIEDLPESVRHNLPIHAQEIYKSAYNNAQKQYSAKERRRNPSESLEQVCHKVAWRAVEQKYKKDEEGAWVLK